MLLQIRRYQNMEEQKEDEWKGKYLMLTDLGFFKHKLDQLMCLSDSNQLK